MPNSGIWVKIILHATCYMREVYTGFSFSHSHIPICLPLEPKASIASFVTKLILNWIHVEINKVEPHVLGL